MKIVFAKECAADGCYNENLGNGKQMCRKHQEMYEYGEPFKAFYGKIVLKKEFQNTDKNDNSKANKTTSNTML